MDTWGLSIRKVEIVVENTADCKKSEEWYQPQVVLVLLFSATGVVVIVDFQVWVVTKKKSDENSGMRIIWL
jgi:hypothetical protein